MHRLLIILVASLALLTACQGDDDASSATATASATASASPTLSPSPTPLVSPTPSPAAAGTLTYTDPTYGYSFEYPASWTLNTRGMILYSYDPASIPSGDVGKPVPKDKLKVFFWVAEGVDKSVDDWLAEGDNSPGQMSPPAVISKTDASLDGKPGIVRITESEGLRDTSYYIPIGNQRLFVINAGPSDSLVWPQFDTVLASIRLPSS